MLLFVLWFGFESLRFELWTMMLKNKISLLDWGMREKGLIALQSPNPAVKVWMWGGGAAQIQWERGTSSIQWRVASNSQ